MNTKKQWELLHIFHRAFRKAKLRLLRKQLFSCGENVRIPHDVRFFGGENIKIGNNVSLGEQSIFMATRSDIVIGDNVMFGPRTTIVTGDHRIDCIRKYMIDVSDDEKLPENDQPVKFCGDNWIGANVTILKGVTVGNGAVIAAGSLVISDIPPYSICGGVPAKVLKMRFNDEKLAEHKRALEENYGAAASL